MPVIYKSNSRHNPLHEATKLYTEFRRLFCYITTPHSKTHVPLLQQRYLINFIDTSIKLSWHIYKTSQICLQNYFHVLKIYFQDMKIYFQALKIYFQGLKILFETGKIYFRNVYKQFLERS